MQPATIVLESTGLYTILQAYLIHLCLQQLDHVWDIGDGQYMFDD